MIKRAIVDFERRGWEESKGGTSVRMSTAGGFASNAKLLTNFKPVHTANVEANERVYQDVARRIKNDEVIRKTYTERMDGSPRRTIREASKSSPGKR
jgi:hypothetical protein